MRMLTDADACPVTRTAENTARRHGMSVNRLRRTELSPRFLRDGLKRSIVLMLVILQIAVSFSCAAGKAEAGAG